MQDKEWTIQDQDARAEGSRREEPRKDLSPAARRALAEAEERRRHGTEKCASMPKEINGRDGPEPTRYGDWEVKGIASDF